MENIEEKVVVSDLVFPQGAVEVAAELKKVQISKDLTQIYYCLD